MAKVTPVDMAGKVVVITGANAGIGKEAAVRLAQMGATVVATARSELRGNQALAEIRRRSRSEDVSLELLDLASFASIREAAARIADRHDRIDVLLNNAGGIISERRETRDGFEMTFGVNHLGHFLLTSLLLDRLTASAPARIINVASIGHRMAPGGMTFADLQHERSYNATTVYSESKLANILFTMELARRLDGTGVTANCCHPGPVRTQFGSAEDTRGLERMTMALGRPFMVTARRGSSPLVYLATAPELVDVSGLYVVGGLVPGLHRHTPSKAARDPEAAARLWEVSEELVASVPA